MRVPPRCLISSLVLQVFGDGDIFGERSGKEPPWLLALHGWGRSHLDFTGVLQPSRASSKLSVAAHDQAGQNPSQLAGDQGSEIGCIRAALVPADLAGSLPGQLGGEIDAIALDLPGFGATPPPAYAWGSDEYADALVGVVETMAAPVVVVGHSFGGRVALRLAVRHPELVAALVLTGVPLWQSSELRPRPAAAFRVARALHRWGLASDAQIERARQRYGSADYKAASGVMRDVLVKVLAESYKADLELISCPMELVWGDQDSVVPLQLALKAAELIKASGRAPAPVVTCCKGVGHLLPLEAPLELRSAIDRHRP